MKTFPLLPLTLLAFLLSVPRGAATRGSDVAKSCCFQYSHKVLPWNWVHTYEFTQSSCSQPAVIFTTKRGKKICAQPMEKWVQRYISLLKTQKQL
ncbi:C-C motif chemokine 26 [Castor canadensis]|uniref:C-C motif chemokine 26 n=5 Tax=Castor canadensis TaxID=51338 RepID=A0AC58MQY1_CASCN|nr:C-C motif chemokine 26 [Castor canadensis]